MEALPRFLKRAGFFRGIAHDQRLNGDGEGVRFVRGGDLGGAGEAGTEVDLDGVEGDDDLEVLGLFGAGGGLRGGDAGGAQERLIADFGDVAFEGLAGEGVDGDVAAWPRATLTMSVSSTLTSAVMTDMSARVIRVDPSAFWMPRTTVSPSRTGTLVTRPSKGATADG